jgi:hypothetical protein
MYLVFKTYKEADNRSKKAISDLKWPKGTTQRMWNIIECKEGFALDVGFNGKHLTEQELNQCVKEIKQS